MADAERHEWESHIDHCVENLRLMVMCKADTSLSSFDWVRMGEREREANGLGGGLEHGHGAGGQKWHLTASMKGTHRCVKWTPLMEWVRERAVKVFEPGVLVGPEELGLAS